MEFTKEQMSAALDEAYKKAGDNAYFANGFALGVEFALQQVKSVDLADVGGSLPSDEAKSWLKKYMGKKLMKNHPEYRTTENMVKYVFSKGWKMAKEQ